MAATFGQGKRCSLSASHIGVENKYPGAKACNTTGEVATTPGLANQISRYCAWCMEQTLMFLWYGIRRTRNAGPNLVN